MITLLFIACIVTGALLYRAVNTLVRQIPDRNGDFNAFGLPDDDASQATITANASLDLAHAKK